MGPEASYELLPSSADASPVGSRIKRASWRHYLALFLRTRALIYVLILGLLASGVAFTGIRYQIRQRRIAKLHEMPSLYPEWREAERKLPQHDKNLPLPEGATGMSEQC
jgi:hypothetical protein